MTASVVEFGFVIVPLKSMSPVTDEIFVKLIRIPEAVAAEVERPSTEMFPLVVVKPEPVP